MPIVHFACGPDVRFVIRQTPKGDGVWEDCRFIFETEPGAVPDWLLIQDGVPHGFSTRVPRERRIVILGEPPSIRHYDPAFVDQFGIVISPQVPQGFNRSILLSQPAVPWFYGVDMDSARRPEDCLSFEQLKKGKAPQPRKGLVSAVCSNKMLNRNQVRRLKFLKLLGAQLGRDLTIFGRSFQRIGDKAEGIDGFRYHLVLENNLEPNAWTEKLADPILGQVFPIIAGGPGLEDYFDPLGYAAIDITKPKQALRDILSILQDDPAARDDVQAAMAENKRRLMIEHQIFPIISAIIQGNPDNRPPRPAPIPIRGPRKSKWRYLSRPFRPFKKQWDKLYLALFERG